MVDSADRAGLVAPQDEGDLDWYVRHSVHEGDRLDYKQQLYGHGDEEKREMLRDITAFANHRGGRIIIGIAEDEDGAATAVTGIAPAEREPHDTWIGSVCLTNVDERIIGLRTYQIPLASGLVAVVIDVPESPTAPHMVTFKGLNQFWKRHGRQKAPMTVDEIRDGFLRVLDTRGRIERLLAQRAGEARASFGDACAVVVSVLPLQFRDEVLVDVRDERLKRELAFPPLTSHFARLTIDGLRAIDQPSRDDSGRTFDGYLELFRNGYLEWCLLIDERQDDRPYLASVWLAQLIAEFGRFLRTVYARYVVASPVLVRMTIYNAHGLLLATSRAWERFVPLTKEPLAGELQVGDFIVEDLGADGPALPKHICDRLWNAFGLDEASCIDEGGRVSQS